MQFSVLGPLSISDGDRALPLGGRNARVLLAVLLSEPNCLISTGRLLDAIWEEQMPPSAPKNLQLHIHRLRRLIGETRVAHHAPGAYSLSVEPDELDSKRFQELFDVGVLQLAAGRADRASQVLGRAVALWRGPALEDLAGVAALREPIARLTELRLTASEERILAELMLGHEVSVIPELAAAVASHPLRERMRAMLMLALYRLHRRAEALDCYREGRAYLADEIGIEPAELLQQVQLDILRGIDPAPRVLQATTPGTNPTPARIPAQRPPDVGDVTERIAASDQLATNASGSKGGDADSSASVPDGRQPSDSGHGTVPRSDGGLTVGVPRLLPADILDFTGRTDEIEAIHDWMRHDAGAVKIVVVSGRGGVGKTALCVHSAHQLVERFPDGQLFADLHGAETDEPTSPREPLGRFLRALGVDDSAVPATLEDRVDLYRNLIAPFRLLIVLDNVANDEQVMPLIPGNSMCGVLINSRARLGATVGARTLNLDVATRAQAVDILSRVAGQSRIDADLGSAHALAELCGYLPLALKIVAAKLASKPHWTVAQLVQRLRDERRRLDQFVLGHLDVRASIGLSFRGLTAQPQRLLILLSDINLPEYGAWTAAALLDVRIGEADDLLERLFDAHLLDYAGRGPADRARYRMHDLVRLFAAERALGDLTPVERGAARARAYGAWMDVLDALHPRLNGEYERVKGPAPRHRVDEEILAEFVNEPGRWFDVERQCVVALVKRAGRDRNSNVCWDLVSGAGTLFDMFRSFDDLQSMLDAALLVARDAGDERGLAVMLCRAGLLAVSRGNFAAAESRFQEASDTYVRVNDQRGIAWATSYTATARRLSGDTNNALRLYEDILPTLEALGDSYHQAHVLRGLGQIYADQHNEAAADRCLDRALAISRSIGAQRSEVQTQFWRAMLRLRKHQHNQAEPILRSVLKACRANRDQAGEAQALRGLGMCFQQAGDTPRARQTLLTALKLVGPAPTLIRGFVAQTLAQLENSVS